MKNGTAASEKAETSPPVGGVILINEEGIIDSASTSFMNLTGYAEPETVGKPWKFFLSSDYDGTVEDDIGEFMKDPLGWSGHVSVRHKNGEILSRIFSLSVIPGTEREKKRYAGFLCGTLENIQDDPVIYRDILTGMPNRSLFNDRLERAVAHARREGRKIAVMLMDVDHFKTVNDSLGHNFGDRLLRRVSERLILTCREEDTVGRMGGDEFGVILPHVRDINDAVKVAQRIRETFMEPVVLDEQEFFTTFSIGITLFPDDGIQIETLIKNADIAVYKAKEAGRNRYAVFTPSMDKEASARVHLESSLRRAMKNDEFRLYFQPKVHLKTGEISGTEALMRWERFPGVILPPKDFIPLAEETGLILPMGRWVLQNACLQTRIWNEMFGFDLSIAVNLSARQFQNEDLSEVIRWTLEETRLPPELLNIEITENIVMHDVEKAIAVMKDMSEMGIRISIDDFGTGYSSLNYLKRFPLDILKIDRTFVKDIPDHPEDIAIAKTILSLARNLNLRVVAEGVEKKAQLDFFDNLGCEEIQGFLFSRPLSAVEMTEHLKQGRRMTAGEESV